MNYRLLNLLVALLLFFPLLTLSACSSYTSASQLKVPPSAQFASGFEKHSPKIGDPAAPIKIYLFSDFSCSNCREGSAMAKKLIMEFPDSVQIIYKHLPNSQDKGSLNAAAAARAAAVQDRFWDMHDVLLQFSRTRTKKEVRDLASLIALDLKLFEQDFLDPRQKKLIENDSQLAKSWGIRRVPSFFINGQRIAAGNSMSDLRQAVRQELRLQPSSSSNRGRLSLD